MYLRLTHISIFISVSLSQDGMFELLMNVYMRCVNHTDSNDGDHSYEAPNTASPDNSSSGSGGVSISGKHLPSPPSVTNAGTKALIDSGARRILTIILNVVMGSLCLPEHTSDSNRATSSAKTNANNLNADKLPYLNQQNLGTLQACDYLTQCLKNNETDILMVEVVLRAMYYMTLNHEANQGHLGSIECNRLVVRVLKEQMDKPKLVYYACLTVSSLAQNNKNNSIVLGQENVCETVVAALNR